jgi:hypothetical protein
MHRAEETEKYHATSVSRANILAETQTGFAATASLSWTDIKAIKAS